MKRFTQYIAEQDAKSSFRSSSGLTDTQWNERVVPLMLKLSPTDVLTDKQLKDLARRSGGIPSSPALLSAHADIETMTPAQLQQVIDHKRVNVFVKHHARQRLSGKWK